MPPMYLGLNTFLIIGAHFYNASTAFSHISHALQTCWDTVGSRILILLEKGNGQVWPFAFEFMSSTV